MSCYVCVMTWMNDSGGGSGGGGSSIGKTTTVINLFNIIITTAIFSDMVASMHNAVMLLAQIAICTQNISADYLTSFTTLSNTVWHFFGCSNHIFRQTTLH